MEKTIREVEALLPEPTKKASEVSCMFGGVSPMMESVLLCQLIEISTKNIELLDNSLWPVIVKVFGNRPFIFQDHYAIPHSSREQLLQFGMVCLRPSYAAYMHQFLQEYVAMIQKGYATKYQQ